MRLASVRRMPLRPVSQYHSGPVSGSTFVSALLRASLRERCAMTEQEIEHVAEAALIASLSALALITPLPWHTIRTMMRSVRRRATAI